MATAVMILGVASIVISIGLYFFIQRRKFYRRNQAGIETFPSYSNSIFARSLDFVLRVLSVGLFLGGIFLIVIAYYGK